VFCFLLRFSRYRQLDTAGPHFRNTRNRGDYHHCYTIEPTADHRQRKGIPPLRRLLPTQHASTAEIQGLTWVLIAEFCEVRYILVVITCPELRMCVCVWHFRVPKPNHKNGVIYLVTQADVVDQR